MEAAPYDLVYSFGVIHHTPHPARVPCSRSARTTRGRSTTLKLMVYSRWSWKVLAIVLREAHGMFWKLDEVVARHSEAQTGCPVTYTYTRRSARRLLEENGFDVDDLFVDHIFPYHVPDYVQYRYRKTLPFRWLPQPAMRALERRLGWHLCVTAHAVRTRQRIDPALGAGASGGRRQAVCGSRRRCNAGWLHRGVRRSYCATRTENRDAAAAWWSGTRTRKPRRSRAIATNDGLGRQPSPASA